MGRATDRPLQQIITQLNQAEFAGGLPDLLRYFPVISFGLLCLQRKAFQLDNDRLRPIWGAEGSFA